MKADKMEILKIIKDACMTVNVNNVESASSLRKAGVDSLDMANILLGIEETFGVKILDEEVEKLDSIDSIIELLNNKIGIVNLI